MQRYGHDLLPLWSLDPGVRHLNHGAYGAVPRVVEEAQLTWKARMEALGTETGGPDAMLGAMATIRLPLSLPATPESGRALRAILWQKHRIEVPILALADALWLRISAAAYNEAADYEGLAEAVMDAAAGCGAGREA